MSQRKAKMIKEQKVNINTDDLEPTARTRRLNDLLRKNGLGGKIVMTPSIHQLGEGVRSQVFEAIRTFDGFTQDNDPYGEHDFAEIDVCNMRVMFKIDYYDKSERFHSPDAADPDLTSRVMTVMMSDEY